MTGSRPRPQVVLQIDHRVDGEGARSPTGGSPVPQEGLIWRSLGDYISEADAAAIDRDANRIADRWYRLTDSDPTVWDGVSLGPVIYNEMAHFLIRLLKNILLTDRLITAGKAARILLGDGMSLDRWGIKATAERHGVPVDELPLDPPTPIEPEWDTRIDSTDALEFGRHGLGTRSGPRSWVRAIAAFRLARRADRADRLASRSARRAGRPVVLSFDDFTAVDPRHRELLGSNRLTWLTLYRPTSIGRFYRRYTIKRRYRRVFHRRWRTYESVLSASPLMRYRGVNLWPVVQSWLRRQFDDAFPYFVAEGRRVRRRLEQLKPAMLAIQWVFRDRCSLTTAVARVLGIPVGVVQTYWAPGSSYPGNSRPHLPVDHFFLWSPISRTWCQHPSPIPARCHYVTHPDYRLSDQTDPDQAVVASPLVGGAVSPKIRKRPTILMTAQYWGPWTAVLDPQDTDDTWPALIAAARWCPQFDFIGKIHPNMNAPFHEGPGGAQRLVNALPRPLPANFRLAPLRSEVQALLANANVVVSYYSTTVIEAAIAGKWTVLLNVSGKRDFLPEAVETGYAIPVREPEQLGPALERVLGDTELQQRMNRGRWRFLRRAIVDGEKLSTVMADVLEGRCRCGVCRPTADGSRRSGSMSPARSAAGGLLPRPQTLV